MGWSVHTYSCGKSWLLWFNCVLNCLLAVAWTSVLSVSSWCFYELICAHISLWKMLVALFRVPNCVLANVWLSVFCVFSW